MQTDVEETGKGAPQSLAIVITTYNRSDLVDRAIRSALDQVRPADEVILVDDGSTDGTARRIESKYGGVKVLHQPNRGVAAARNLGVASTDATWIAFLDDDDWFDLRKLQVLTPYLDQAEALYHPLQHVRDREVAGPPAHVRSQLTFMDIMSGAIPSGPPGMIVRRHLFIRAGGFPVHVGYGEDWVFALNVARLSAWTFVPEPLTFVDQHRRRSSAPKARGSSYTFAVVPASMWLSGRPLPEALPPDAQERCLMDLGQSLRQTLRPHFRGTLSWSRRRELRLFWRATRLLLPRGRDRLYLLMPERLLRVLRTSRSIGRSRATRGS